MNKLYNLKNLSKEIKKLKLTGKKIVFTVGAYDLIHCDHARFLLEAKTKGDILIVGLESNLSRRTEKGVGHPLIDQKTRAEMLSNFSFVDFVIIIDKKKLLPTLKKIRPHIFYATNEGWRSVIWHGEANFAHKIGTNIMQVAKHTPYVATSTLVKNVADLKIKEIMEYFFGKINIDLKIGNFSGRSQGTYRSSVRGEVLHFGNDESRSLLGREFTGEVIPESKLANLGTRLREEGKKIVFTAGTYDLLHVGHARFLEKAKSLGDILVVGVPTNAQVTISKGRGRPIVDQESRASLLCHLNSVNFVVIFNEPTVLECLKNLRPHIFYTVKEEWNEGFKESPEYATVKSYGGNVVRVSRQAPYLSASKIIDRAAGIRINEIFKKLIKEAVCQTCLKEPPLQITGEEEYEWN